MLRTVDNDTTTSIIDPPGIGSLRLQSTGEPVHSLHSKNRNLVMFYHKNHSPSFHHTSHHASSPMRPPCVYLVSTGLHIAPPCLFAPPPPLAKRPDATRDAYATKSPSHLDPFTSPCLGSLLASRGAGHSCRPRPTSMKSRAANCTRKKRTFTW